jgi:hypothetical protein
MANIRSVNLLPQVFRTDTNKKFLNATIDQLLSRPELVRINGYVGRKFAPTNKITDSYIGEQTALRQNYQLEPSVVVSDKTGKTEFFGDYIDLLQQIQYYGGTTLDQDRLFSNETYSYSGLFEFDKLINFNQYYWLPTGPESVDVRASGVPVTETYTVTRDESTSTYKFSTFGAALNPEITLAHGGVYQFVVNQPGNPFYIQSDPGTSGTRRNQPNTSSRDILGVTNNGIDVGTVTFRVPTSTAQDNFSSLALAENVNFVLDMPYREVHNRTVSYINETYGGLDGIETNWQGKKVIFLDNSNSNDFWTSDGIFDFEPLDTVDFESGTLVPQNLRYSVWTVQLLADDAGNQIVRLVNPQPIAAVSEKVFVLSGENYANNEYFINRNGLWELVPTITASSLYLYYQDGNSTAYAGRIKLVNPVSGSIDVNNEIIGKENYRSPNGVVFTNGLKVRFDTNVTPSFYADNEYFVEGVGTAIVLISVDQSIQEDIFDNQPDYVTINRGSIDRNSWTRNNRWFHIDVINKTAEYNNTLATVNQSQRALRPIIEFESNLQLFNYGTVALDAIDHIVIDTVTNALVQVEGQLADSNTETVVIINDLEFTVANGDRIVFASDTDLITRNKVFTLEIVDINSDVLNPDYRVHLVETDDVVSAGTTVYTSQVVSVTGIVENSQYHFNGNQWTQSQQKTQVNQPPLFDVFTENNVSLVDNTLFLNSAFRGTKLFSYKSGSGAADPVLGFPLSYRNFNNVGDIQFDNNFDNDEFTNETTTSVTDRINQYYLRQNNTADTYQFKNVWVKTTENSKQYQLFNYVFDGTTNYFEIDILPEVSTGVPTLLVYRNFNTLDISTYAIVNVGARTAVRVSVGQLSIGDAITIKIYSKSVSQIGYHEVPKNLDLNSINSNFENLTLGQLRNHLITISHNSNFVTGDVPGVSNIRDIQVKPQGGSILQHASPVIYSNLFLLDKNLNFIKSIEYAQKEYTKFKNKFLELAVTSNLVDINNIVSSVDVLLQTINRVKNSKFPWYYSDMVPYGDVKQVLEYRVLNPQLRRYELASIFNDTQLSARGLLVYYYTTEKDQYGNIVLDNSNQPIIASRRQLIKDKDFVFEQDRPAIRLLDSFTQLYNDIVVVHDYANTNGSFIPETPTKLGLYPAFVPEIFVDDTYLENTTVIQGHDGSLTPAFGDYRDDLLVELERRIYNNIKINYQAGDFNIYSYTPGKFRDANFSLQEFTGVLTQSFLKWVGNNRVDYITNSVFNANNPFTWNYKNFKDVLPGNENLQGTWRAVYKYFYDTDRPHTHPWEMLGLSKEPDWWTERYGPAPYTGGNLVLWEDLELGYIHGENRYDEKFARPGLTDIIPVNDTGNLRSPESFLVKNFNSAKANTSYSVGDIGPTENAWRRSSEFPFATQIAIALTRPGVYFGTLSNVDNYTVNANLAQYTLKNNLQRIRPAEIKVNGINKNGQSERCAGYINWIGDYLTGLGIGSPGTKIQDYLNRLDVRLSYKLAGYTDKNYIKILAEQSSPTSTNESVIVPNENYEIYLNKSTPTRRINYSAVIVQKSAAGYTVNGYDLENPYFYIIPSLANNNIARIQVGNTVGIIYQDFQNYKVKIPYGFEFNTKQQVVDFLISYERYLVGQGMRFDQFNTDLQVQQDFVLSAREFLTWSQQGWKEDSLIILSPVIDQIYITNDVGTVDEIENSISGTKILDQNFNIIKNTQFTVNRTGADFKLTVFDGKTVALAQLNLVEYEHALIFDNTTLFNDIIYKPELGNRQFRLKIVGSKTSSWNGQLDIPGFIYNNETVQEWTTGKDYQKGELVIFKDKYYVALQNVLASTSFVTKSWKEIDKNKIKTGLLKNLTYNAGILENIYDINNQPADEKFNQFSKGLIGFRERNYLTDLGMDTETQTKFYQGYIKQKGTRNAVTALSSVELNNLTSSLDVFEEWGLRVGEYGAVDSNDYVEVTLDEELFREDPSTFVLITDTETAQDQIIGIKSSSLYRRPNNYNTNILRQETAPSDRARPLSAGYVNLSDVDYSIYNLQNYGELLDILNEIGTGYKIWVAKDFDNNWNVYRVNETGNFITGYEYNLNTLIRITTFDPHNFEVGNIVAFRNFDPDFDGFYRVFELIDTNSFFVTASRNPALIQEIGQIYGTGTIFLLTSVRAATTSGIVDLTPPYYWRENDKLWVDNDGDWAVYEKSEVWTGGSSLALNSEDYVTGNEYGNGVRLNENSTTLIIGAPGAAGIGTGLVRVFSRAATGDTFSQSTVIQPFISYASGFGRSLDIGNNVIVVGAPDTLLNRGIVFVYNYDPVVGANFIASLRASDGIAGHKFGTSVSISRDDRWLYVGAPGADSIYAYALTTTSAETSTINKLSGTYDQSAANVTVSISSHGFTVPSGVYSQAGTSVTVTAAAHGLKIGQPIWANVQSGTSSIGSYLVSSVVDENTFTYTTGVSTTTTGAIDVWPRVNVYVTSGVAISGYANVRAVLDPDTFALDSNVIVTSSGVLAVTSYTLDFVPDAIDSVGVRGQNRIYIADLDYSLNGRVIDFESIEGQDIVTVNQSTYYKLVANISATTGNTGQFGQTVKCSTEGAQVLVGAPTATVDLKTEAGAAFVYDRIKEGFYTDGITSTYVPTRAIGTIYRVTVNGVDVVEGTDYNKILNAIIFTSTPPGGQFVEVEINDFQLISRLGDDVAVTGAKFGTAIDLCPNNCSVYIGAPNYVRPDYFAGRVYRYANQGRIYGTVVGNIPNPYIDFSATYVQSGITITVFAINHGLSIGDRITADILTGNAESGEYNVVSVDTKNINGTYVQAGTSTVDVTSVQHGLSIGDSVVITITAGTAASGTYVVATTPTADTFTYISSTTVTTSGTIVGVSVSRQFTITSESPGEASGSLLVITNIYTPVLTAGDSLRLNGIEVTFTGRTVADAANNINNTVVPGVSATVENGQLRLNSDSKIAFNVLSVLPGTGNAVEKLGIQIYPFTQAIEHPYQEESEYFGTYVKITDTAETLIVTSQGSDTRSPLYIDAGQTVFDQDSTRFANFSLNAGTAYVFDFVAGTSNTIDNPGQFTFVQQLSPDNIVGEAYFGSSIDANQGFLIIGAKFDNNVVAQGGEVYVYNNQNNLRSWNIIRQKEEKVDLESVNKIFVYDKNKQQILASFDHYDPLKGKILGIAEQELDYISSFDPARYNQANPTIDVNTPQVGPLNFINITDVGITASWGKENVGKLWWNLDAVRYIDYEQDSLTYRSKTWGQIFPGSVIEVCEWIEGDVPPGSYTGEGTVKYPDNTRYSVSYYVDKPTGLVKAKYYYWVINKFTTEPGSTKTKSAGTIAEIIKNPQTAGVPYIAAIRRDAFNLYHVTRYLSGTDSILHINYNLIDKDNNLIHSEYHLIQENSPIIDPQQKIIQKFIDSLCGVTIDGSLVPDPALPDSQKYGIASRPRQSVFIDRTTALANFVNYVNTVLIAVPTAVAFDTQNLYTADPIPAENSGLYDEKTPNYENLDYLDLSQLPIGYKILVEQDTRHSGLWTISELTNSREWELIKIQTYRTDFFVDLVDWDEQSFDKTQPVDYSIQTFAQVSTLTLFPGNVLLVNNDGSGRFAYYIVNNDNTLSLVGLQRGTVQINESLYNLALDGASFDTSVFDTVRFDQNPTDEIRSIATAIVQDIFIKSLSTQFSQLVFALLNYVLSEQKNVDWVFKTSFISILHKIRKLDQYPNFVRDNQTYYLDYINEVKPYRTQVREYILDYEGSDLIDGNITDFDLPGYYDALSKTYRSPNGSSSLDGQIYQSLPYQYWFNNYKYQVSEVEIVNAGVAYEQPPLVIITGGGGSGATAEAEINLTTGAISAINVVNPGTGYTTTPQVIINGYGSRDTKAEIIPLIGIDGATPWTPVSSFTINDIISYLGNTYTLANTSANASGQSYSFPDWSNSTPRAARVNTAIVPWANDTLYADTESYVISFSNNVYIANTEVINANLWANSASFFPFANAVVATTANVTFNFGNVTTIDVEGKIIDTMIVNQGDGFTVRPILEIFGSGIQANLQANIDAVTGKISDVTIVDGGFGYAAGNTAIRVLDPNTSASASARLKNVFYRPDPSLSYNTVRSIDTRIKFDRITYSSNVQTWAPNSVYYIGDTVSYNGEAWRANTAVTYANVAYASNVIVAYNGNLLIAANADTSVSALSVTFANAFGSNSSITYENATVADYDNTQTYAANTIVKFGINYFINANSSANVSGLSYTFPGVGTVLNANVLTYSNTATYTFDATNVNNSSVFEYVGTVYILANTTANATGQSFNFPAWSNSTARASRINANVVAWEPGIAYDTSNLVIQYLGNVFIANTEVIGANLYANSARYFGNANVVAAASSNLTFSSGNVVASTAQQVTFNPGNVTPGSARVTVNPGNVRIVPRANTVAWTPATTIQPNEIFSINQQTFVSANTTANVSGRSFAWFYANSNIASVRINANVVTWQPDTIYDTSNIVLDYLGNIVIANILLPTANLYANSAAYFANANATISGNSFVTFNYANTMPVDATIVPSAIVSLDKLITYYKNDPASVTGNLDLVTVSTDEAIGGLATGVATVRANVINSNLVFVSNTIGTLQKGTVHWLRTATQNGSNPTYTIDSNLDARVNGITYVFDVTKYQKINAFDFINASDRTMAYYQPGTGMPGKNLSQLFSGMEYPGVQIIGNKFDSNISITSNVLRFFAVNNTITTANVQSFNFERADFGPGQTIDVVGSNFNNGTWTIGTVTDNAITVFGASRQSLAFGISQTFVITTVPNPEGAGAIYQVDGVNKPVLNLVRGGVYTFDQSAATNNNHPIAFRDSANNSYTLGVVTTGTPGTAGAQTVFTVPSNAPDSLRYYCTVHGNGMGNTITVTDSGRQSLTDENAGADISIRYGNENNPLYLDTTINSNYADASLGLRPEDINVDGGKYVDTYSSHGPEEFVPGRVFDNLNVEVYTLMQSGTANVGYRMTHNMITVPDGSSTVWPIYYRINGAATTTLTANLNYTDSNIYVSNASVLPTPNPDGALPGVIFINGEKIYYYRNIAKEVTPWVENVVYQATDIVSYLGNTYIAANASVTVTGATFNTSNVKLIETNVLTQIRRGVDGTGIANTHITGSRVVDSGLDQLVPGRAHELTWLNAPTGEGSAFQTDIGDFIVDNFASNLVTAAAEENAVTDGGGLEGSGTLQARFIKQATAN